MTTTIRPVLIAALTLILMSSQVNGGENARMLSAISSLQREDGTTATVAETMAEHGLKGLSVAVIDNYRISWTRTWGVKSVDIGNPIGSLTAFNIASISKPVTSTLIAMLAEQGLIDLDTPVSTYLKRWQLPDNDFTRSVDITLRHLLSHTSGATQHGYKDFYSGEEIPTIVDVLNGGELPGTDELAVDFRPGSRWRYSGGGYVIAQMVVEDHFARPLADVVAEHILEPLSMTNTTMRQPNEDGFPANAAKVHDEEGDVISSGLPVCPQLSASGIWSTPSDMARFLIEMQEALRGSETDVISPAVARLVTTEVMDGFGLGWAVFRQFGNRNWFSHGGANTGTGGYVLATMEDGHGIVFFGNGPNSIREPVLAMFRESIIEAHGWRVGGEQED